MTSDPRILLINELKKETLPKLNFNECIRIFSCYPNIGIFTIINELPKSVDVDYYENTIQQKK